MVIVSLRDAAFPGGEDQLGKKKFWGLPESGLILFLSRLLHLGEESWN